MKPTEEHPKANPRVGLFVTCLVDLFRPSVGFASVKLLEEAGCTVEVPVTQTCCGQPAYNSGDRDDTRAIARTTIEAFEDYDYVVVPSGSCGGMLRTHYPGLFTGDAMEARATAFSEKTYELVGFLVDVMGVTRVSANHEGTVTYHDACAGLRELNIKDQPRELLSSVNGLKLREMKDPDICCGFGGTFCVKHPDIANAVATEKTANITGSGAETLLAGDLGCLMNMADKLRREGAEVDVRHVAEVLAGMDGTPAIGKANA